MAASELPALPISSHARRRIVHLRHRPHGSGQYAPDGKPAYFLEAGTAIAGGWSPRPTRPVTSKQAARIDQQTTVPFHAELTQTV